jgi:hypothetical protein
VPTGAAFTINVKRRPAAGNGSVVANSVAEFRKIVFPLSAAVKVLAAVVVDTAIGPRKPFSEITGPEKVVFAMKISSHAS